LTGRPSTAIIRRSICLLLPFLLAKSCSKSRPCFLFATQATSSPNGIARLGQNRRTARLAPRCTSPHQLVCVWAVLEGLWGWGSPAKARTTEALTFTSEIQIHAIYDTPLPVSCKMHTTSHDTYILRLGLPNVLGPSFPFSRHRFCPRAPERRRVLLVPHQLHPRGRRYGTRVLREVRIRAGLFRQEHLGRRALGKPIHPHGMGLYPIPEEIMNVFPRRRRLQGPRTSVRSRYLVTGIEQSGARRKQSRPCTPYRAGEGY